DRAALELSRRSHRLLPVLVTPASLHASRNALFLVLLELLLRIELPSAVTTLERVHCSSSFGLFRVRSRTVVSQREIALGDLDVQPVPYPGSRWLPRRSSCDWSSNAHAIGRRRWKGWKLRGLFDETSVKPQRLEHSYTLVTARSLLLRPGGFTV